MRSVWLSMWMILGSFVITQAQTARVLHNGQHLFASGANIAWVQFGQDFGASSAPIETFESIFADVQQHQGNTLRLWVHTHGETTPDWSLGFVTGPGQTTLSDLVAILDAAQRHQVRLILCLWSFDMLRTSFGEALTTRNYRLLTNGDVLQSYLDQALLPMVRAVKAHPALLAWEVFNEPEGMTNEFGWNITRHVRMADVQRFINRVAGVIHREDPVANVTSGAVSIATLSQITTEGFAKTALSDHSLAIFNAQHQTDFSAAEWTQVRHQLAVSAQNYYSDAQLIAAGGDQDGTLDFYSCHYYDWGDARFSPFHRNYTEWGLTKPLLIAEFFMDDLPEVSAVDLYETLLKRGYAGAMGWQWYDRNHPNLGYNWTRMLQNMTALGDRFPDEVRLRTNVPRGIQYFRATPDLLAASHETSRLSWRVADAQTVWLNGEIVPDEAEQNVNPEHSTRYVLHAKLNNGSEVEVARWVRVVNTMPDTFGIRDVYPNPSSGASVVRYQIPERMYVSIDVLDALGRIIRTFPIGFQEEGFHDVPVSIQGFSAGVYWLRIVAGGYVQHHSWVLMHF